METNDLKSNIDHILNGITLDHKNVILFLQESWDNPVNDDSFNKELLSRYIQIIDPKEKSIIRLLCCADRFYFLEEKERNNILSTILFQRNASSQKLKIIINSLEYFCSKKEHIIHVFNTTSANLEQREFFQMVSLYSNQQLQLNECAEVLSFFNYCGNSTIRCMLPEAIENAYLKLLNIHSGHCQYICHEREIIPLAVGLLLDFKNISFLESPIYDYLLQIDKSMILESMTDTFARCLLYKGQYNVLKQIMSDPHLMSLEHCNTKITQPDLNAIYASVFSELRSDPERFGANQWPSLNILKRLQYADRMIAWEAASDLIAHQFLQYSVVTPLALSTSQLLELISNSMDADKILNMNLTHDNTVTLLSIIAHSYYFLYMIHFYSKQDESFKRHLQLLFTPELLVQLLPDLVAFKEKSFSHPEADYLLASVEKITDHLILLGSTTQKHLNHAVNFVIEAIIHDFCGEDKESLAKMLNCIKCIISRIHQCPFISQEENIQLSKEIKKTLEIKLSLLQDKAVNQILQEEINVIWMSSNALTTEQKRSSAPNNKGFFVHFTPRRH